MPKKIAHNFDFDSSSVKEFMSNFLFILKNEYPAGWPVLAAERTLEKDYFSYFGKRLVPKMLFHSATCWNDVIKTLFNKNVVRIITRDGNILWKCWKGMTKTEMHTMIKHGPTYHFMNRHMIIGKSPFAETATDGLQLSSTDQETEPQIRSILLSKPPNSSGISQNINDLYESLVLVSSKKFKIPTIPSALLYTPELPESKRLDKTSAKPGTETTVNPINKLLQQHSRLEGLSIIKSPSIVTDSQEKPYRRFHSNLPSYEEDSQQDKTSKSIIKVGEAQQSAQGCSITENSSNSSAKPPVLPNAAGCQNCPGIPAPNVIENEARLPISEIESFERPTGRMRSFRLERASSNDSSRSRRYESEYFRNTYSSTEESEQERSECMHRPYSSRIHSYAHRGYRARATGRNPYSKRYSPPLCNHHRKTTCYACIQQYERR